MNDVDWGPARGPSGLMVRASDYYSQGLGFESQLDPGFFFFGFFSVDLFLTLSTNKQLACRAPLNPLGLGLGLG